jgi:hypothetical protein
LGYHRDILGIVHNRDIPWIGFRENQNRKTWFLPASNSGIDGFCLTNCIVMIWGYQIISTTIFRGNEMDTHEIFDGFDLTSGIDLLGISSTI